MRNLTKQEISVCKYLNRLRNSGTTNMFGATSYILDQFYVSKAEAQRLLKLWMNNFQGDENEYDNLQIKD